MDRKIFAIDMDDVVADLDSKVTSMYLEDNGLKEGDVEFDCWYKNWEMLHKYYVMPDIYADLEVIGGSRDVLFELHRDFDIYFVTASPNVDVTKVKYEWVDEHFPFIGSDKVIPTRHKHLIKADLLFDDSPKYIADFKHGFSVVMDKAYNQGLSPEDYDFRVFSWLEFFDLVKNIF